MEKEYIFSGIVRSRSDDRALPDAYVLLKSPQGKIITYSHTDSLGEYKFKHKSLDKSFIVEISFVGFNSREIEVEFKHEKEISNLSIIYLDESIELKAAVVTHKQLIRATDEGYLYDVESDSLGGSTKILNLLSKLPFLDIGINNKIQYFGRSAGIVYLLNGKRSILFKSSDLILKMIAGKNIKSIELIPNPLPPFDRADAVVNIVTKGSLFDGVLFGASLLLNGANNLNITPKISIIGNNLKNSFVLDFEKSNSVPLFNTSIYTLRELLSQNGEIINNEGIESYSTMSHDLSGYSISASYSRVIKKENSFTIGFGASKFINSSSLTLENFFESNSLKDFTSITEKEAENHQYSLSLGYSKGSDRGKGFNINYSVGFSEGTDLFKREDLYSDYLDTTWTTSSKALFTNNIVSNFNLPLSATKNINVTAQYALTLINSRYEHKEELKSFSLKYLQNDLNIESGYSFRIKKKTFLIKGTLNYFNYFGGESFYNQSNSPLGYNNLNLIPSLTFSMIPGLGKTFKINYNRLSIKPSENQINPYVDESNPLYLRTGNPNLKPSVTNYLYFNFGYQKRRHTLSFIVKGGYSLKPIMQYNTVTDSGVHISTFENIGKRSEVSLRYYHRYLFSREFELTSTLEYSFRNQYVREWYQSHFIDYSLSGKYNINAFHKLSAQVGTRPGSQSTSPQSTRSYNYFTNTLTYFGSTKNARLNYMIILNNIGKLKKREESLVRYESTQVHTEYLTTGMNISIKISYMFGQVDY